MLFSVRTVWNFGLIHVQKYISNVYLQFVTKGNNLLLKIDEIILHV